MKGNMDRLFSICFLFIAGLLLSCTSKSQTVEEVVSEEEINGYLFVYFKDDTHSLYMAVSNDGYTFTDVNNGQPVMKGDTLATQKGIRDPHIYRAPDGAFCLAMTDLHLFGKQMGYRDTQWERDGDKYDWGNNRGFVLMKSHDLINWTHANVIFEEQLKGYEDMACAWAPQTIWDDEAERLMIYFTMRERAGGKTKLYYCYVNSDYNRLESEPELLFQYPDEEIQYLDADINKVGEFYHMFYVAQEKDGNGIKHALSKHVNRDYEYSPDWVDHELAACEAPNAWRRLGTDTWVLMYDVFGIQPHNFGFCETTDFINFTNIGRFNEGVMKATNFSSPKHGAITHITHQELNRLATHWGFSLSETNEK